MSFDNSMVSTLSLVSCALHLKSVIRLRLSRSMVIYIVEEPPSARDGLSYILTWSADVNPIAMWLTFGNGPRIQA